MKTEIKFRIQRRHQNFGGAMPFCLEINFLLYRFPEITESIFRNKNLASPGVPGVFNPGIQTTEHRVKGFLLQLFKNSMSQEHYDKYWWKRRED